MLATGSNTYGAIAEKSYIGRAALNPSTNWALFLGGSYDDAQVFATSHDLAEYGDERRAPVGYTRIMEDRGLQGFTRPGHQ